MEEWAVLESFTSEVEARVVESFLRAQGLEVQLLDTHMNAYAPTSRSLGRGMRLMVRTADVERAREMLLESRRATHLEIAGEYAPPPRNPYEKWIIGLLLFAAALTFLLSYFKPK
jgi:hypothetical protein